MWKIQLIDIAFNLIHQPDNDTDVGMNFNICWSAASFLTKWLGKEANPL